MRQRLDHLGSQDTWLVDRTTAGKDPRSNPTTTTLDLRKLVPDLRLQGDRLVFTLAPSGESWARPGEVLALLGLDGAWIWPTSLARTWIMESVQKTINVRTTSPSKGDVVPKGRVRVPPEPCANSRLPQKHNEAVAAMCATAKNETSDIQEHLSRTTCQKKC